MSFLFSGRVQSSLISRSHQALTLIVVIQLLTACGGGGSGGTGTTNPGEGGSSSSSSSSSGGSIGNAAGVMTWNGGAVLSTGDRYASGSIGEDGSAAVIWGQSDNLGPYVKAKASYFSNDKGTWTTPSLLDATAIGIQKVSWKGGVQALGTVAPSLLQNAKGGWDVWWRYCQMTAGGFCNNTSSLSFNQLDQTTGMWSSPVRMATEFDVKAEESFSTIGDTNGNRWLSGRDWIAPLASSGSPTERRELSGVNILDSLGNLYVFSAKENSIVRYDVTSKKWTSYALTAGDNRLSNPHLIRYFEHAAGKLTFYWNDAAGTNSVRLWVTALDASKGTPTVRTVQVDTGVSSYYGEAAASDENGVTLMSIKTTSSSRSVTAIRYDFVLGAVSSIQQLDIGALIDHASPMRLQRLGDRYVGVWESKSSGGRVSVKAVILDPFGKILSGVQEIGFVEAGKKELAATIYALWLDANGAPNLVWNVIGEEGNSWLSSVYSPNDAQWSVASIIRSSMPLTHNSPFVPVLLQNANGDTSGIFFQGIGVAILGLNSSGDIVSGVAHYPTNIGVSEYLSGRVLSDRTLSILCRDSDGNVLLIKSRR